MQGTHSSTYVDDIRVMVQAVRNWFDQASFDEMASLRRELRVVIDYAVPMLEHDAAASSALGVAYSLLAINCVSSALQNVERAVPLRASAIFCHPQNHLP
ncbi:MAG: hypothetical protein QOG67_1130 [Verrucomicrobiota bacterium]|jgi:hypothetical protein